MPDPELRRKLTPTYRMGCKRVLISNDYLPALGRENVEVVTDAIREVRARSIVTADGTEREVDTIIFGTGFHVTDLPAAERVRGRDGRSLAEVWDGSPQAHLGTMVAGCPNLFFLVGPNTGLGHNSIVFMIESQCNYVLDALRLMDARGAAELEVRPEAQAAYNARIQEQMRGTVWTSGGCASWYLDAAGATRRCGRPSPGPSARARAGSTPRTTSCARRGGAGGGRGVGASSAGVVALRGANSITEGRGGGRWRERACASTPRRRGGPVASAVPLLPLGDAICAAQRLQAPRGRPQRIAVVTLM